jgi:hypothetical protein
MGTTKLILTLSSEATDLDPERLRFVMDWLQRRAEDVAGDGWTAKIESVGTDLSTTDPSLDLNSGTDA